MFERNHRHDTVQLDDVFEVTDGNDQIPCAISRAALEEISERRCFKAADLLGCFAKARGRIERLALEKASVKARQNHGAVKFMGR